jgi:hypothetical protein
VAGGESEGPAATRDIAGRVLHATRQPTPTGASRTETLRPSRRIAVDAVDPAGTVLASAVTDDDGLFALRVTGADVALRVRAYIAADGFDLAVTRDAFGHQPHELIVALPPEAPVSGRRGARPSRSASATRPRWRARCTCWTPCCAGRWRCTPGPESGFPPSTPTGAAA